MYRYIVFYTFIHLFINFKVLSAASNCVSFDTYTDLVFASISNGSRYTNMYSLTKFLQNLNVFHTDQHKHHQHEPMHLKDRGNDEDKGSIEVSRFKN